MIQGEKFPFQKNTLIKRYIQLTCAYSQREKGNLDTFCFKSFKFVSAKDPYRIKETNQRVNR